MHRARLLIAAATALTAAAMLGGTGAERAEAGAEVCTPCVIVIEVDGLEAKDVTPHTTPFLWALGHGSASGGGNTAGDPGADPVAIGAAATPGISGRSGWTWAAARGVMTGTTAAATTALLTGSYAEQSDIFADEFLTKNGSEHVWMGRSQLSAESEAPAAEFTEIDPVSSRLPSLVEEQTENKAGAWLGDARLEGVVGIDASFKPAMSDSVPAYCPAPQDETEAQAYGTEASKQTVSCPTVDLKVINEASDDLADDTTGGKVTLGYIYLAELGAIKRLHGDVDATTADANNAADTEDQDAQAVADQLAQTDAAIGAFVNKYARDEPDKWSNTVLFVVGNHGYELTPQTHRVPDDMSKDPGMGLADVVSRVAEGQGATGVTFIPQGTIGTVYVPAGPNHDKAVTAIAHYLRPGGEVDRDERCHPENTAGSGTVPAMGCIQEVLATGAVGADGHTSTIPDAVNPDYKFLSVADKYPGWRLHYVDPKTSKPSGSDGDLMVVLAPGWAAGQFVPLKDGETDIPDPISGGGKATNPYLGSAGGPRNRSIAAIVNGRTDIVRQLQVGTAEVGASPTTLQYPVSTAVQDPDHCPTAPADYKPAAGNPNLNPADDADALGHECQAEVVDFAPTIAALLHISVTDTQLGGRFLREAFVRSLSAVREEEEIVNIPPDDPPPPPEPDVYIPDPPEQKPVFTYSGLMKKLKATVADKDGCTWATAKPGAQMDYIKIEADFGKALSSTTLTFYRQGEASATPSGHARKAGHSAHIAAAPTAKKKNPCLKPKGKSSSVRKASTKRPPLKAIARFNPFALKRGHVVLKLKIPDLYRPSHIGVFVQEALRLDVPKVQPDGSPGLTFEPFGPAAGDIVRIDDGTHLHDAKPAKAKNRTHARTAQSKRRPK